MGQQVGNAGVELASISEAVDDAAFAVAVVGCEVHAAGLNTGKEL